MKIELSAGGVIFRKSHHLWEVLLMKDMNDSWTFPKGIIEENETPEIAAKREIGEEVGIFQLTYHATLPTIEYTYTRNGLVKKRVHYFVFLSDGDEQPKPQREEGIKEVSWVPLETARVQVGYRETNLSLLEAAIQTIIQ